MPTKPGQNGPSSSSSSSSYPPPPSHPNSHSHSNSNSPLPMEDDEHDGAGGGGTAANSADKSNANLGGGIDSDRLLPIANISRIMKKVLPDHAKMSKVRQTQQQNIHMPHHMSSHKKSTFMLKCVEGNNMTEMVLL